jgi:hypothetical protein
MSIAIYVKRGVWRWGRGEGRRPTLVGRFLDIEPG